jgi:hypothetical protein
VQHESTGPFGVVAVAGIGTWTQTLDTQSLLMLACELLRQNPSRCRRSFLNPVVCFAEETKSCVHTILFPLQSRPLCTKMLSI